jgi:hypothetical protein
MTAYFMSFPVPPFTGTFAVDYICLMKLPELSLNDLEGAKKLQKFAQESMTILVTLILNKLT